jgi:hypothetical protein
VPPNRSSTEEPHVRHLPIPLLGLLAATTLAANLVVLDDAVTTAAATTEMHDGAGERATPAVRDLPTAMTGRADTARLQARADAWPITSEAAQPDAEPEVEARDTDEAVDEAAGADEATARTDAAARTRQAPGEPAVDADPPPPAPRADPEPTPTPTPARPAPAADDPDDCDLRCRGARLHRQLRIQAPPNWTVEFEDEHPAYLGLADSRTRTITIYLRASLPDRVLLWTLYHEVGHSHDFTYLSTAKRDRWSAARGYAGETWFGCNHCTDYETPAGDWAEAFASCHTGWDDEWRSELGAPPTAAQCELLHELREP